MLILAGSIIVNMKQLIVQLTCYRCIRRDIYRLIIHKYFNIDCVIKNIGKWLCQSHAHFDSFITFHYSIDCLHKADVQRY